MKVMHSSATILGHPVNIKLTRHENDLQDQLVNHCSTKGILERVLPSLVQGYNKWVNSLQCETCSLTFALNCCNNFEIYFCF